MNNEIYITHFFFRTNKEQILRNNIKLIGLKYRNNQKFNWVTVTIGHAISPLFGDFLHF